MSSANATLRLDRLLANLGYGSRKDIQSLVRFGRVVLDGAAVADASLHIPVTPDLSERLKIAGAPLDPAPGFVIMMHKPLGVTCSHKETGKLIYELLPQRWRARKPAISTIGRLDKETSGLLLMTDDGALLHRIIAPKSNVAKRYRVALARPLRGDEGERLASGTLLLEGEEKPLLPVILEHLPAELPHADQPHADQTGTAVVHVTLTEGRYHQVRRMFASLGNHVVALHRDRVGDLTLPPDLDAGRYRILSAVEVGSIFTI